MVCLAREDIDRKDKEVSHENFSKTMTSSVIRMPPKRFLTNKKHMARIVTKKKRDHVAIRDV